MHAKMRQMCQQQFSRSRFFCNAPGFADSSYQDSFIPFSKDADLLISECNFYADQDGTSAGHMNSLEAGRIAKEAGAGELVFWFFPMIIDG